MIKTTVLTSLYRCEQYLEGYFSWVAKLQNIENIEILLLHNEPSKSELDIINRFVTEYEFLKHIIIPERESLYATWNRGVRLSNGEYIAIWNVDDVRLPDSLYKQQKCLDDNPDAALTYGDIIISTEYGMLKGEMHVEPQFSRNKEFYRNHFIGCFPMWRKSIHDEIGYFDEQFRLVADFDFQIRVVRKFDLIKTNAVLGYYLEFVSTKLSSNRKLQKNETNALVKRYGIYSRIDLFFWKSCSKFIDVNHLYYNADRYCVRDVFEGYDTFVSLKVKDIFSAIIKQPRFLLAYIKHDILKY